MSVGQDTIVTMNELEKIKQDAFNEGARYAIEYFRDEVYGDGVMETDLWADFFGDEDE